MIESPVLEPTVDNLSGAYLQIKLSDGYATTAVVGDWIIKNAEGEFTYLKPLHFTREYEPILDSEGSETILERVQKVLSRILERERG